MTWPYMDSYEFDDYDKYMKTYMFGSLKSPIIESPTWCPPQTTIEGGGPGRRVRECPVMTTPNKQYTP